MASATSSDKNSNGRSIVVTEESFNKKAYTFLRHAASHSNLEVYSYLFITYILVTYAHTFEPSDPNASVGVAPQMCFEADTGKKIPERRHPDVSMLTILDQLFPHDSPEYIKPILSSWFELKALSIDNFFDRPARRLADAALPRHMEQLCEQALFAFREFDGDEYHAFLVQGNFFSQFLFLRPANWDDFVSKNKKTFDSVKEFSAVGTTQASGPSQVPPTDSSKSGVPSAPPAVSPDTHEPKFAKGDLPIPQPLYSNELIFCTDSSGLSLPFLNGINMSTANFKGKRQASWFDLPLGTSEDDIKPHSLVAAEQAIAQLRQKQARKTNKPKPETHGHDLRSRGDSTHSGVVPACNVTPGNSAVALRRGQRRHVSAEVIDRPLALGSANTDARPLVPAVHPATVETSGRQNEPPEATVIEESSRPTLSTIPESEWEPRILLGKETAASDTSSQTIVKTGILDTNSHPLNARRLHFSSTSITQSGNAAPLTPPRVGSDRMGKTSSPSPSISLRRRHQDCTSGSLAFGSRSDRLISGSPLAKPSATRPRASVSISIADSPHSSDAVDKLAGMQLPQAASFPEAAGSRLQKGKPARSGNSPVKLQLRDGLPASATKRTLADLSETRHPAGAVGTTAPALPSGIPAADDSPTRNQHVLTHLPRDAVHPAPVLSKPSRRRNPPSARGAVPPGCPASPSGPAAGTRSRKRGQTRAPASSQQKGSSNAS